MRTRSPKLAISLAWAWARGGGVLVLYLILDPLPYIHISDIEHPLPLQNSGGGGIYYIISYTQSVHTAVNKNKEQAN